MKAPPPPRFLSSRRKKIALFAASHPPLGRLQQAISVSRHGSRALRSARGNTIKEGAAKGSQDARLREQLTRLGRVSSSPSTSCFFLRESKAAEEELFQRHLLRTLGGNPIDAGEMNQTHTGINQRPCNHRPRFSMPFSSSVQCYDW